MAGNGQDERMPGQPLGIDHNQGHDTGNHQEEASGPAYDHAKPQNVDQAQLQQSQPDNNAEAEAFLQPTFINVLNELNAVTERLLLPESAQIEADTRELQHTAEASLQEVKAALESEQSRLLHMASIVQRFHEQIMQVLPQVPSEQ